MVLFGGSGSERFIVSGLGGDGVQASPPKIHGGDGAVVTTQVFGVESIASITLFGDTSIDTLDLSGTDAPRSQGVAPKRRQRSAGQQPARHAAAEPPILFAIGKPCVMPKPGTGGPASA